MNILVVKKKHIGIEGHTYKSHRDNFSQFGRRSIQKIWKMNYLTVQPFSGSKSADRL